MRLVTEKQVENYPSKVLSGQKFVVYVERCTKLSPERQLSSSSSTADQEECEEKMIDHSEMDVDESFVSPEADLGTINRSLKLIGISPFKKRNMKRTMTYVPRKKG